MKLTRSRLLGAAAGAAGAVALSGCSEAVRRVTAPALPGRIGEVDAAGDPAWRALNRMAYGPRPGDLDRVRRIGLDAYVEEQLAPEKIEESWAAQWRPATLDTLEMDASEAHDFETAVYPEVGKGQAAVELQQAAVLRAVYSNRQLEQVMVEFWTDHFNISQLKAECSWLKTVDDRIIRRHAMGRFRDLVAASARSPAMLFYLDNDKNRKRDAATGSGPNENYARELLELHTLGVDGGYTLADIQEVARCFSGWSYKKNNQAWPGEFVFEVQHHDEGPKRVLGVPLPAGRGAKDGDAVIDLLCRHPATARFIARKLCRRFVAERGPERLVARLAASFQKTDGDIRQVLSVLFHSEEFRRGGGRKLKRPFDFAISALRALNADTTGEGLLAPLERMGQLPYKWAMPDGYPDRAEAWTHGLLARWNFALALTSGQVPNTEVDASALVAATGASEPVEVCRRLSRALLGTALPDAQLRALAALAGRSGFSDTAARQCLALLLCTPGFQWR